jgi:subtilase family serine protease
LLIIITLLLSWSFVTSVQAQLPQVTSGLSYLTSSQIPDGSWRAGSSLVETTTTTVTVLETQKLLNLTGDTAYSTGASWLQGQSMQGVDPIAGRIRALSLTGGSVDALIPLFNPLSGAWGGDIEYETNNLDTSLALQALKAANYPGQSVIFQSLSYLITTQNADGGWGFTKDDDSSVFVTAHVLRTLAQYKTEFLAEPQVNKAVAFLLSRQNPDGGFGSDASTVYETALAFIAVVESGQTGAPQVAPLQNAINYLTASQSANGSWNDDPYSTALALQALARVKPDLTLAASDINVSPATPAAGNSVAVTAAIRNAGLDTAAGVTVRLTDNGATVAEQTISAISSGGTAQASFTIPAITPYGDHNLSVVIDPANGVDELNEANNAASTRIWAKSAADLVVYPEYLSLSPDAPKPGEAITLSAMVANMGESAAQNVTAALYDGDPVGGVALGSFTIAAIDSGSWGSGTISFSLSSAGSHDLTLVVDPQHLISEESRGNNSATRTVSVTTGGAAHSVDLIIPPAGLSLTPGRPRAGENVTVTVIAQNLGNSSATADLELFDGDPATGVLLHRATIALNAGETRTVAVPWIVGPGIHTLTAYLDRAALVTETDKLNNSRTLVVMADMVDIEISASDIAIEPSHPMAGDPATVKVTVRNRGILPAGTFTVNLYNGDPAAGGVLLQSFEIADLAGDASQELIYGFTADRGTYRFHAVCDPDNRVSEMYEGNNLAIRSLLVKSSAEAKGPDLAPLEFDLSAAATDPQNLRVSGMAKVKFQNKGDDKVTTPFRVTVFEDRDGDGLYTEGTDLSLGWWDYSAPLNPSMVGTVDVMLAGSLTFRDSPIYATIDSGQAVFEQDKSNNTIRRGSACEARPVNPIEPVLKWQWPGTSAGFPELRFLTMPIVMGVSDNNGDGRIDRSDVPSVLINAPLMADQQDGIIWALRGDTGAQLFSMHNSDHKFSSESYLSSADIDNDGKPEIVVGKRISFFANGGFPTVAFENDGTFKWDNTASVLSWGSANPYSTVNSSDAAHPAIADLDGDGVPEIIAGSIAVLNADGSVRCAPDRRGISGGTGGVSGGFTGTPLVVDLDLDGKPEILGGNVAYNADCTVKWQNSAIPDGFDAIGNFDDDPYPEIIVVSPGRNLQYTAYTTKVWMLDHNGSVKWGPIYIQDLEGVYNQGAGGFPVIADFDGDGKPDIGVSGVYNYLILDSDGRLKRMLPFGANSYSEMRISPTVFDLNGDGRPEILINAGGKFKIFDGTNGSLLFQEYAGGGYDSVSQNVIVADVDGNGHAEAIVSGAYYGLGQVLVYRAKNDDWVNTRRVWNQDTYHVTNVNDNGSIPQNEAPSWLLNNSYRCNVPTSSSPNPYLAADLSASFIRLDMADYPHSATITARIGNGGSKSVAPGVAVSFYDGDPAAGGVLIGSAVTSKPLGPGEYEDVSISWKTPADGNRQIQVIADPNNGISECDKANNAVSLPVYVSAGWLDLGVAAEDVVTPVSIPEGRQAEIVTTVRNSGTLPAENVLVRLYAGNPNAGGKQIGADQVIPVIAAGGTATVRYSWDTLGSQGVTYLYVLVDPAGTIADANRGNNTAIREAFVTPADKPDLLIAAEDLIVTPASPREGDTLSVSVDVHNRGTATGNVKVALYNGNPATGGVKTGETSILQTIPFGGTARATLAMDTVGLAGALTLFVKIDPDNAINESDEANNQASRAVTIAPAGLTVGTGTDKSIYGANENVQVSISVAEHSGGARNLTYDLQILDMNGVLTAIVAADVPLQFGPNATQAFTAVWNTGETLAGSYTALVRIKELGRVVAKASTAFTILPVKTIAATITTDKLAYGANETVAVNSVLKSSSPNHIFETLTAKLTIGSIGSSGTLYTETKSISTLIPGATFTFKSYWDTGASAPGTYPVAVEVTDAAGAVIATATQNLVIVEAIKPSNILKGAIVLDKQNVLTGEPVMASYVLTNAGNVDLSAVAITIQTICTSDEAVYNSFADQATLAMGAKYTNSGLVDTQNYGARDYLVVLRATVGGVEETLAGTYFRVEGAPSAPALSAPANGSDVQIFTPALVVSNAADPNADQLTYEFEVYADAGLTNLVVAGTVPETAAITAWSVSSPLTENATYHWRARAYDGQLYGPWMAPARFRVNTYDYPPSAPTISNPMDGMAVATVTPVLTIGNATDPDSPSLTYNYEVALDADFTTIVSAVKGVASGEGTTSWTVPENLQENGTYYWRAQADDWLVEGPWSTTGRFFVNTVNDPPTAPVVTAPVHGSTVPALETEVIIANSHDPDSAPLSYYFEVDTVSSFDSANALRSGIIAEGEGSSLWHVSGLLDNTRYFVRAKASDGLTTSPWSAVVSFFANTANDAPTAPTLANPSNGAGVTVFTPTLSVQNASDLDHDPLTYEFALYADAAMTTPVATLAGIPETEQTTSWNIPVTLAENTTYYWQARASDGQLTSPWMPLSSFTVNTANDAPGAPQLVSPGEGISLATLTPTFTVANAPDPDSASLTYQFEVYAGTSFVAGADNVPQDTSGITSTNLGTPLTDNTLYQWRARAFDGDIYGPWTSMGTFSVHLPVTTIGATINFDPDTLSRKSKGNWVTVMIELPAGHKPEEIDVASIRLEGTIPAESRPYELGDSDKDGIPDLMVKFDRNKVINLLPNGERVSVHVTGKAGSVTFEGVDVIRVIP